MSSASRICAKLNFVLTARVKTFAESNSNGTKIVGITPEKKENNVE